MEKALNFLRQCGVFYLATSDENQPHVRPFGAVCGFEGKLYLVTNNQKKVFNQLRNNPKIEISGTSGAKWIRIEAEAVIDLINAENNYALKSAVTQLKGSVSEKIKALRAEILEKVAYIEAALDDPEHIEMENFGEELLPVIDKCRAEIDELIANSDSGRIIKEGIKTVIVGKPNVGKSSLLNALLGSERAIVTDIAGTTRDTLEESISLGDVSLNIVDTAGIRDTQDLIEKIGVDKAREASQDADLIVFIIDASKPVDEDDMKIAEMIKGRRAIVLINKTDLPRQADTAGILENFDCPVIETSVTENTGIDEFVKTVKDMFYSGDIDFNNQVFITNARQKAVLIAASESLAITAESIENGLSEDFYTIDMMDAYESLGQVIGEAIEDDLADEIFSKFCMGK